MQSLSSLKKGLLFVLLIFILSPDVLSRSISLTRPLLLVDPMNLLDKARAQSSEVAELIENYKIVSVDGVCESERAYLDQSEFQKGVIECGQARLSVILQGNTSRSDFFVFVPILVASRTLTGLKFSEITQFISEIENLSLVNEFIQTTEKNTAFIFKNQLRVPFDKEQSPPSLSGQHDVFFKGDLSARYGAEDLIEFSYPASSEWYWNCSSRSRARAK